MEVFKTENNKKILLNNVVITILICALFSCITIIYVMRNKNPVSNTQTQSITVNGENTPKVNINTATREELKTLPSIGDKLADKIISKRPYKNIYEIVNIEGIGDKNFKNIERRICIE